MKFTWFNLMPWPYLPDDFREKYRSVWVDIPSSLYDPEKGHHLYHTYLDQLEYAEELGFDGLGVNEHHANGYGLMPSPNIMAATLSRRTSRAALVDLGNSIALYNPPLRVTEEFAMLDVLSGGRLIGGFPVGTSMDTNYCYGQIPALTRDKYREAHDLIIKAWAANEAFAFNGEYTKLRYVNCWPKPIQKPHPPIFIPGGGSLETYDFCLDHDYNYSYLSFTGYVRGKELMDGYWNRVAARGKDESPYRAGFAQIVCVGETDAEAEQLYAEPIKYFFNRCLHVFPGFADAPGYRTIKTIKAGVLSQLSAARQLMFSTLEWKTLVDDRFIIAGGPDTVCQQMEEMIRSLRVGHVFCLLHMGNMRDEVTRHSTKLFAEKVMPKLRNIWPEYANDDRFWIKPLASRREPQKSLGGASLGSESARGLR
jgi:alkanesulfonate monooxygenase SsuD/methylene tetrahydromethanopterin reductase-like flavin-dependent oxidoreductase (luciferase family)